MVFLELLLLGLQVLVCISKELSYDRKRECMIKVFETRVTAIGSEAADMINAANMLILFGQGAPADLADFCYTIDNKQVSGSISVGGQLVIDQMAYDITAVGAVVEKILLS